MADGVIVRKGEGKSLRVGPDGPDDRLYRLTGAETGGSFDYVEATISYLQGPSLHLHHDMDDTIIVIEGTLKVQVGDVLTDLYPGDISCAPKGVPHAFANLQKEPCRMINILTPGESYSARMDTVAWLQGGSDPKLKEEMDKKHGSEQLGPTIPVRLGLV